MRFWKVQIKIHRGAPEREPPSFFRESLGFSGYPSFLCTFLNKSLGFSTFYRDRESLFSWPFVSSVPHLYSTKALTSVYFIAGPRIVEQMISENLLNKLYCSTSMCIMGSENYDKIIRGDFLKESKNLKLVVLYLYSHKTKIITQLSLFQVFDLKGK